MSINNPGTGNLSIPRRYTGQRALDHTYIACLECRFVGSWQAASLMYKASGGEADVALVELNGTRRRLHFREGAIVHLLPSNVLTYESDDEEESLVVDENEQDPNSRRQFP
jgi:hypothetical protein